MMESYEHAARSLEPLPLDTMTAIHLLDLFRDPDHDVDRVVEFISQDPLLTAETLRRCNNAVFGGAARVTDVFEAVNRLGYYEVYDIVAASVGGPELLAAAGVAGMESNPILASEAALAGISLHSRDLALREEKSFIKPKSSSANAR